MSGEDRGTDMKIHRTPSPWKRLRSPEVEAAIQAAFEAGENAREIAARFGMTRNAVVGMAWRRGWVFGGHSPNMPIDNPLQRQARLFLRLPPVHHYAGATLFSRLDAVHAAFEALTKANRRVVS